MKKLLISFFRANTELSRKTDSLFFEFNDRLLLTQFFDGISAGNSVADVGGGKKPAKEMVNINLPDSVLYDGFDISLEELEMARAEYSEIHVADLTAPDFQAPRTYDRVICRSTLEHVSDVEMGIRSISSLVEPGGQVYLKIPCGTAMFARLNKILPNELKRRMLHFIFPHKAGDGFEVFYDRCTPSEIIEICSRHRLKKKDVNLVKFSTYFTFFFPLYLVWRCGTILQQLLDRDYCENFEIILDRQ